MVLKNITNVISTGNKAALPKLFILFVGLSIVYYIVIIVCRNRTHVILRPFRRQCLYKKYMNQYLELDNNEVEKI